MRKIRKAVIPAAGLGTRFLPITKAIPKEMLPIIDTPIIQYVVNEAVAAGVTDIIIVTNGQKPAIREYFRPNPKLERHLIRAGKRKELAALHSLNRRARFRFVTQAGPYGNATPVRSARAAVGNEPFVVLWGDEFIWATPPRLVQMMRTYQCYGCPVISGIRIPNRQDVHRYGIARAARVADRIYRLKEIVEKPEPKRAPSNLAVHGAYILTPGIFPYLERLRPGRGGEVWLVDAINAYASEHAVYAHEISRATYYDTGNKIEYLKANIDLALKQPDISRAISRHLSSLTRHRRA